MIDYIEVTGPVVRVGVTDGRFMGTQELIDYTYPYAQAEGEVVDVIRDTDGGDDAVVVFERF